MPKITIIKEKTGQVKYKMTLPKDWMQSLGVSKGDALVTKSLVGTEVTFVLKRKPELDAEKRKSLQDEIDKIK